MNQYDRETLRLWNDKGHELESRYTLLLNSVKMQLKIWFLHEQTFAQQQEWLKLIAQAHRMADMHDVDLQLEPFYREVFTVMCATSGVFVCPGAPQNQLLNLVFNVRMHLSDYFYDICVAEGLLPEGFDPHREYRKPSGRDLRR